MLQPMPSGSPEGYSPFPINNENAQSDPSDIISRLLGRTPGAGVMPTYLGPGGGQPSAAPMMHPMVRAAMHGSPRSQLNAMATAQAVARTLQHLRRLRPAGGAQ